MSNPNPFAGHAGHELRDNLIGVIFNLSDLAGHSALYAAISAIRHAETAADRERLVEAALTAATHANAETIRLAVDMTAGVLTYLPDCPEETE